MADLPKGFYTGPDGNQRFWDGQEWFDSGKSTKSVKPKSLTQKLNGAKNRTKIMLIGGFTILVLAIGSFGVITTQAENARVAAEQLAIEQAAELAAEQAAAEEADLEDRRANRVAFIEDEIEPSIRKMAKKHASSGIIVGPVLSVSCTTTGGVALEDISIRSMLFECFVATKDNGDGTQNGVFYHARANWDDGSYTYGLGKE